MPDDRIVSPIISHVYLIDSPTGYCYDMYRKIDRLVQRFQPRRALVLSFDGPAPFAKLQHQRAHRTADPDTCAITPGTTFMNAIDSGG
jgi:5'-3' exonuclease